MKQTLIALVLITTISFAACGGGSSESKANADTSAHDGMTAAVQYTCPMHPEVISDKPGKCPKCGMDLVEKKDEMAADSMMNMNHDSMHMDHDSSMKH